jgi:hypothetical protein
VGVGEYAKKEKLLGFIAQSRYIKENEQEVVVYNANLVPVSLTFILSLDFLNYIIVVLGVHCDIYKCSYILS